MARAALVMWLACCAPLLSGCAGMGTGGPGTGATAPDRSGRFTGWYQGRQIPSSTNASACRSRAREIWFVVEDGSIEMRNSRHRRNRRKLGMLGTVSADGSVAMRQATGGQSVVGRIENDRLTAATVIDAQDMRAVQGGARTPCAFRFEAARRPDASGRGNGDASAAAYGPPPI